MLHDVLGGYGYQLDFLIDVGLSLLAGFLIGAEISKPETAIQ